MFKKILFFFFVFVLFGLGACAKEETPPHEHIYESVVVDATCTKEGYTTYTCSCGHSYVDNKVEALGHEYSDGVCIRCPYLLSYTYLRYEKVEDGYAVYGTEKTIDLYEVIIPSTHEGLPVVEIGEKAFEKHEKLLNVVIPEGVTKISNFAFYKCKKLPTITIPSTVKEIGEESFLDCFNLVEVYNLSDLNVKMEDYSLGFLGDYARIIHTSKEEKSIIGINEEFLYYSLDDEYYFLGFKENNYPLILPQEIESHTYGLHDDIFAHDEKITSINIPANVVSIGNGTFSDCNNLTSVTYSPGSKLKKIGANAFSSCNNLLSFVIPSGVVEIGSWALGSCRLVEVYNLSNIGTLDKSIFYFFSEPLIVNISPYVKSAIFETEDGFVFIYADEQYHLISYTGDEEEIVLPQDVEGHPYVINDSVFRELDNLVKVEIPDTITTISASAFENCRNLKEVILPENLVSIEYNAFSGCFELEKVEIPKNIEEVGRDAFYNCSLAVNYIDYHEYIGNKENPYLVYLGIYVIGEPLDEFVLNESTRVIANGAFRHFNAYSVTIPEGVKNIPADAFAGNQTIMTVKIPDSVTCISEQAFYECESLAQVILSENSNLQEIKEEAFSYCENLESIVITSKVTSIDDYAFIGCDRLKYIFNDSVLVLALYDNVIIPGILVQIYNKGEWSFINGQPYPNQ